MKETWNTQTNEQLCAEYQQTKDNDLFEYFLSRNYGLIANYLKPILSKHPEQKDELTQQCEIAMWEAMKSYDSTKDALFSSYVYYYFKKNAWHNYHEQYLIHIPINSMSDLQKLKEKVPYAVFEAESLEKTIFSDTDEGSELKLEDKVASKDPSPLDLAIKKDMSDYIKKLALKVLSAREYRCIELYYGLDGKGPKTLQIVGDEYGVTRERIRQILEKAIMKIKRAYIKEKLKYEDTET